MSGSHSQIEMLFSRVKFTEDWEGQLGGLTVMVTSLNLMIFLIYKLTVTFHFCVVVFTKMW